MVKATRALRQHLLFMMVAVVPMVAGCQTPDRIQLTVYNNTSEEVVVRLRLSGVSQRWSLGPQEIGPVVRGPGSLRVDIELLDPETCGVLASEPDIRTKTALVVLDRGPSGSGDWNMTISDDDLSSMPLLTPTAACP